MSSHLETGARGRGAAVETSERSVRPIANATQRPTLLFFCTPTSGLSRRSEGFLANVLQRRRNHETFELRRIDYERQPDLAARCGIDRPPAIVVIEENQVRARLEQPRGCAEIQTVLAPWLK